MGYTQLMFTRNLTTPSTIIIVASSNTPTIPNRRVIWHIRTAMYRIIIIMHAIIDQMQERTPTMSIKASPTMAAGLRNITVTMETMQERLDLMALSLARCTCGIVVHHVDSFSQKECVRMERNASFPMILQAQGIFTPALHLCQAPQPKQPQAFVNILKRITHAAL